MYLPGPTHHHYRHLGLLVDRDTRLNHGRKLILSNQPLLLDSRHQHRDMDRYHHYCPHPYLYNHHHRDRLRKYSSIVHRLDKDLRDLVLNLHRYQHLLIDHHSHPYLHQFCQYSLHRLDIHRVCLRLRRYRHLSLQFDRDNRRYRNRSKRRIANPILRIDIGRPHLKFHLGHRHSSHFD